ncbi:MULTISPECIES: MalY/PatB family protein [Halocynthiibacter]|uniref:cysteine-S-conjugate beta-lyase n=1 Tax=Halocynthiibacter halioticoli TaxID=2986804 RepID=A0AAE3IZB4_9RHOB|nr:MULTISPECIES: MalY/PatB family protein [Halocynthiibacter]MCV6823246.1 pyridoxal phosphate-dependent aminotransferase [Halocynthiibacter halioticoli]MCW4056247.1 pyridoxal phosphate-dependent aminotransferase [Halocynthiibacter sp. SDUM655004]
MNFDEIIDRRGTGSDKWDQMESLFDVSPDDGLAMWVADTDFRVPQVALDAMQKLVDHGILGYSDATKPYKDAVCWWMENRHGWKIEPEWLLTTSGLVNAVAIALDTFTEKDDGVVLFTPVYHAFAKVIKAQGRTVVECPLVRDGDKYVMDFEAYDAQMTGKEKMLILCSPHNPAGRVWTKEELSEVVAFAKRHDQLLISDEIHQDLVYDGYKHVPTALIEGALPRLITLNAPSKTFNVAGANCGHVIIPDEDIRTKFFTRKKSLGLSPNVFGVKLTQALYNEEGGKWVDALCKYLGENRKIFEEGVAKIPGAKPMHLEGTYLAWVDFSDTGMSAAEVKKRITQDAKIAATPGHVFGKGGEHHVRFNLGLPASRIEDAVERLQNAFSDLQ